MKKNFDREIFGPTLRESLDLKDRFRLNKARLLTYTGPIRTLALSFLMTLIFAFGVILWKQGAWEALKIATPLVLAVVLPAFTLLWLWGTQTRATLKRYLSAGIEVSEINFVFNAILTKPQLEVAESFLKDQADITVLEAIKASRELA